MNFVHPEIHKVFSTDEEGVTTIVIENQKLLLSLVSDIYEQTIGNTGLSVLSENGKILPMNKRLELMTQFVPFEINTKTLVTKICGAMEKSAISDEFYEETMELMNRFKTFLYKVSFNMNCDLNFGKFTIGNIIKAVSPEIQNDGETLGEKILDYMELVTEYDAKKLFITLNLRTFLSDKETEAFISTVTAHKFNVIMVEGFEHNQVNGEIRYIIDKDLCEIC